MFWLVNISLEGTWAVPPARVNYMGLTIEDRPSTYSLGVQESSNHVIYVFLPMKETFE